MRAMTFASMYGSGGLARVHAFRSQPAAGLAVPTSWLHLVAIDGKTVTGARHLGEPSP